MVEGMNRITVCKLKTKSDINTKKKQKTDCAGFKTWPGPSNDWKQHVKCTQAP